jgi:hypothetical protein
VGRRSLCHGDGYIDLFPQTVVVHGLVENPSTVVAELEGLEVGGSLILSNRYALFSPNSPGLRLNSAGWIDLTPVGLIDIISTELLYALTREKVLARISPFSKRIRLFVESYLSFIWKQIESLDKPNEDAEVFTHEDWVYSAWLPMPHAHILLPPDNVGSEISFAEFDIVFWTGEKLVCVDVEQSGSILPSKRAKRKFLEASHPQVDVVSIDRELNADVTLNNFPGHLFDKTFGCFWNGLDLPQGPCPSPIFTSVF